MCNAKRVYAMDYKVNWDSGGVFAVPDAAAEALRLAVSYTHLTLPTTVLV